MTNLFNEITILHNQLLIEIEQCNYNRAIFYARSISSMYNDIAKDIYENNILNIYCSIEEHNEELPNKYNSDYDRD